MSYVRVGNTIMLTDLEFNEMRRETDELRRDAARYRFLRDEDSWGEDTGNHGGSAWLELGELSFEEFDEYVDRRKNEIHP